MKSLQNIKGEGGIEFIIIILFVAISIVLSCRGILVDKNVAIRAVETQGFSNIKVIDHAWFAVGLRGCSSKDAARFTVKATNPAGKEVECYVCSGWLFKGATIRTK
ncbi:MAG: hypothetical protein A2271_04865 [Candidatus Moranbacteria bacterium RIFOXYA12_FULL_35_19]|nr:MAG: hypothetical protein UR78_C0001G0100 [Candidatus Moranbacteria bacterium GW2011_GWF2_35_39]OGI30866.1 MAG: hypothetical protein A2343_00465 [Candidatus Moranbacteria bacterium RIFOXYB12_FULL_35_8]OGI35768.1 MAG: hypothetical protein A2271_04865 [Candidatus Moranbacteria bacterium RIFOXYA12_FULL_35_19]